MPDPGFRLSWLPVGHILQALAHDFAADLAAPLAEIAEGRPFAIRRAGPDGWFLVGEAELSPADFDAKAERIAPVAGLIDQSHGRRRLLIEGPRAERRLAHGIGLDLARLPVGAACETQYDSLALHLTRVAPDSFEILIARSFAQSLWEHLES